MGVLLLAVSLISALTADDGAVAQARAPVGGGHAGPPGP